MSSTIVRVSVGGTDRVPYIGDDAAIDSLLTVRGVDLSDPSVDRVFWVGEHAVSLMAAGALVRACDDCEAVRAIGRAGDGAQRCESCVRDDVRDSIASGTVDAADFDADMLASDAALAHELSGCDDAAVAMVAAQTMRPWLVERTTDRNVPDAGGYVPFAIMDDGDVLCWQCVEDRSNPVHRSGNADGWRIEGWDHTGNVEDTVHCAHCNRAIGGDQD